MRKFLFLSCVLVAAGAAAAETRAAVDHGPQPTLEQLMQARAAEPRFQEAESSRPLFFRLANASAREVRFQIAVAEHPYLEERVTLGERASDAPAVELLAREPARLERLYALAAGGSLPVRVTVFVDGVQAGQFGFDEFVRYNRELKSAALRPVAGTSELRLLALDPNVAPVSRAAAPQPDGACEDQCYWDYLDCQELLCNGGCYLPPCPLKSGDLPSCAYCTTEYNNCLAACAPPPCTDPKSVTTYSTTELVGVSVMYWDCFKRWWDPDPFPLYGDWYEALRLTYKITTYRRTEYCNGSVVIEVIGVSYGYAYCNHPLYFQCYNPWTYPYNVCY